METTIGNFADQIEQVLPYFQHFQIDIADGEFVNNKTISIEEITDFFKTKKISVANSRDKTFEFHLMVQDWIGELQKLKTLVPLIKITGVFIHLKVFHSQFNILNTDYVYGIVLNPEDTIEDNWEVIKYFPKIQIMTSYPGRQGTPFILDMLNKIDQLRHHGYKGIIILDGGINDQTLPIIVSRKNQPDAVCPGSFFKDDVENRLRKLSTLVQSKQVGK